MWGIINVKCNESKELKCLLNPDEFNTFFTCSGDNQPS